MIAIGAVVVLQISCDLDDCMDHRPLAPLAPPQVSHIAMRRAARAQSLCQGLSQTQHREGGVRASSAGQHSSAHNPQIRYSPNLEVLINYRLRIVAHPAGPYGMIG